MRFSGSARLIIYNNTKSSYHYPLTTHKALKLQFPHVKKLGEWTHLNFTTIFESDYPTRFYNFIFSVVICPNTTRLGA